VAGEANKLAFRRAYEEVFNQGNLAVVEEVIAEDFVNREEHPATTLPGPEAVRAAATLLRTAFPDLHFTIDELVAEGELVAGRLTMRGTHKGPLLGILPTGRAVEQAQMHFLRFRDGKAVEHWAVRDDAGLLRQLGVSAEPQGAGQSESGG
jgi:steroid delta-isomerase-like uncharacterized protein